MQIYPVANARHHMMIFIYFISMLELKLIHVNKRGHRRHKTKHSLNVSLSFTMKDYINLYLLNLRVKKWSKKQMHSDNHYHNSAQRWLKKIDNTFLAIRPNYQSSKY